MGTEGAEVAVASQTRLSTLSYLLDTDICSHLIKVGTAAAMKKLEQVADTEVRMSIVTWAELLFGCALRPEATAFNARVQAFAQLVEPLAMGAEVAAHYADIRSGLQRKGTPIGSNDVWIAAHARATGMTVVTHNLREFRRVPDLKLEDWLAP